MTTTQPMAGGGAHGETQGNSPARRGRGALRRRAAVGVLLALALGAAMLAQRARHAGARAAQLGVALDRAALWLRRPNDRHSTPLVWLALQAARRSDRASVKQLAEAMAEHALPDPLSGLIGATPAATSLAQGQVDEDRLDEGGSAVPGQEVGSAPHPIDALIGAVARCARESQAKAHLLAFLQEPHSGYLLTHQLLFSLWARELGCTASPEWKAREAELTTRVAQELGSNPEFSHLFVEQMAVLQLSGRGEAIVPAWVTTLLAQQRRDGSWHSPIKRQQLQFRGATIEQYLDPLHMTLLGLSVLAHHASGA